MDRAIDAPKGFYRYVVKMSPDTHPLPPRQKKMENGTVGRKKIDGLIPALRSSMSCSQTWRQNSSEMESRQLATADPHFPAKVRGALQAENHPAFGLAFPRRKGESEGPPRTGVW